MATKKVVDTLDLEIAKPADINIPVDGPARVEGGEIEIATDIPHVRDEKSQMLAFLQEKVKIFLMDAMNPNDEQFVFCSVNGVPALPGNPYLRRGQEHTIPRSHVEVLARARNITYSQPFKEMPSEAANTMRSHSAMKYPFQVIEDNNPRGQQWLRSVMASA